MEQANGFDFVDRAHDPIFLELRKLTEGCPTVTIASYTVTLNAFSLFEIESIGIHDCVSTLEQCYRYLCTHTAE
ncbi:hypothetical protein [Halobacillus kuroshimensis]|uniref:hypothetical protein n=1 Tax=Halobacillus kuroshimensis TaxID=302481 RepID=UPI00041F769A|nr:hypothetical protein [Halobacillus kuroshimensis]